MPPLACNLLHHIPTRLDLRKIECGQCQPLSLSCQRFLSWNLCPIYSSWNLDRLNLYEFLWLSPIPLLLWKVWPFSLQCSFVLFLCWYATRRKITLSTILVYRWEVQIGSGSRVCNLLSNICKWVVLTRHEIYSDISTLPSSLLRSKALHNWRCNALPPLESQVVLPNSVSFPRCCDPQKLANWCLHPRITIHWLMGNHF